jgi:hypothetical protein
MPQTHHAGCLAETYALDEQVRKRFSVLKAECADRPKVRLLSGRQISAPQLADTEHGDSAGGVDVAAPPVQQKRNHHHRIERRRSPGILDVPSVNRRQIKVANHVPHEIGKVVLRHPILRRQRQQVRLLRGIRSVSCAHNTEFDIKNMDACLLTCFYSWTGS